MMDGNLQKKNQEHPAEHEGDIANFGDGDAFVKENKAIDNGKAKTDAAFDAFKGAGKDKLECIELCQHGSC